MKRKESWQIQFSSHMRKMVFVIGVVVSFPVFSQEIKMSPENSFSEEEIAEVKRNLDLAVVAEVFGASSDLEDFEKRLNDPESKISNLDVNGDGKVDYLKVVEKMEGNKRTVYVQVAEDKNSYKYLAALVVVKDSSNVVSVRVVGDESIYGRNYVVIPAYRRVPLVVSWFWGPSYRVWVSPYRFGYYPAYYRSRVVVASPKPAVHKGTVIRTGPTSRKTVIIRN